MSREEHWLRLLRRAFGRPNNLTSFYAHGKFLDWCQTHEEQALDLLLGLWSDATLDVRFPRFLTDLPREAVSGTGTRLSIASFLLMGQDVYRHPFLKWTAFTGFKRLVGESGGDPAHIQAETTYRSEELALRLGVDGQRSREFVRDAFAETEAGAEHRHLTADQARQVVDHFGTDATTTEPALYAEWVMLLEELSFRVAALGSPMRDPLEAQSAAWWLVMGGAPEEWDEEDARRAWERFQKPDEGPPSGHDSSTEDGFPKLGADLEDGSAHPHRLAPGDA